MIQIVSPLLVSFYRSAPLAIPLMETLLVLFSLCLLALLYTPIRHVAVPRKKGHIPYARSLVPWIGFAPQMFWDMPGYLAKFSYVHDILLYVVCNPFPQANVWT